MATRRRLLLCQSLLAQQSIRGAIPKPRTLPIFSPHRRLFHSPSPSPPAAASATPSSHFLWRSSGLLLPMSAAAARAGAARWMSARGAPPLEVQKRYLRRMFSGDLLSKLLRYAPWNRVRFTPLPDGAVLMLITANVAVFILWHLADQTFMEKHFMISLDNFKSGRLHTLLTTAFSHRDSGHLFANMVGLYFFGRNIGRMFGPTFVLSLYAAGALAGSTFFLFEKAFIAPHNQASIWQNNSRASAPGASGAVDAIILLQIFLYPKQLVYLYYLIPVPAALVGAVLIGADLWMVNKGQGEVAVSSSAKLGGALVAALMWARIKKGWI